MERSLCPRIHPAVLRIQALLGKIDRLNLPAASRRDVESILVRQASKEIDRALPWQAGHGRRTAAITAELGQAAGLDIDALHRLKLAAFLHDLGLLTLPERLTACVDTLSSEAYMAVQNHSRLGAQLLEPFSFLRDAAAIVAHHHERWDGSGYPYGIRGLFIPLEARILSLADAFDAIRVPEVTDRATRNRIALRIIQVASGTQFDPQLVELFGACCSAGSQHAVIVTTHSAPYMHNGRFDTLDEVVTFYAQASDLLRQGSLRNGAAALGGIAIVRRDIGPLVSFLKSPRRGLRMIARPSNQTRPSYRRRQERRHRSGDRAIPTSPGGGPLFLLRPPPLFTPNSHEVTENPLPTPHCKFPVRIISTMEKVRRRLFTLPMSTAPRLSV